MSSLSIRGRGANPLETADPRRFALARHEDPGIDPAILAWLVAEFPTEPLPEMLKPLTPTELAQYRDELAMRLRAVALKT